MHTGEQFTEVESVDSSLYTVQYIVRGIIAVTIDGPVQQ